MRNFFSVLLIATTIFFNADAAIAAGKKPVDMTAIDNWGSRSLLSFTTDGEWTATLTAPSRSLEAFLEEDEESAELQYPPLAEDKDRRYCVSILKRSKSKSYEICSSHAVSGARFSADGSWFGLLRRIVESDGPPPGGPGGPGGPSGPGGPGGPGGPPEGPPKIELVLLDLSSGEQDRFKNVVSFDFASGKAFMQRGGEAALLIAMDLQSSQFTQLGPVSEFAINSAGTQIAWLVSAEEGFGNGVYLSATDRIAARQLDGAEMNYEKLSWADEGDALIAIKTAIVDRDSEKVAKAANGKGAPEGEGPAMELEPLSSIFAARIIGQGEAKSVEIGPSTAGFPEGQVIMVGGGPFGPKPAWSDDRSAILLTLRDQLTTEEAKKVQAGGGPPGPGGPGGPPPAEGESASVPDLALWHWNQAEIPNQDGQQLEAPSIREYPAVYWTDSEKLIRLLKQDDPKEMELVGFQPQEISQGKSKIVSVLPLSELDRMLAAYQGLGPAKVSLIDTKTGSKQRILENVVSVNGTLSPNGNYVVYFADDNFSVYDISKSQSIEITQNLNTSFVGPRDDNYQRGPAASPRWTKSGGLLLEDHWDVWYVAIPDDGGEVTPVNLTVDGAQKRIDYSLTYERTLKSASEFRTSPPIFSDVHYVDDEFLLLADELDTLRKGYVRANIKGAGIEWLKPLAMKSLPGTVGFYSLQALDTVQGRRYILLESDMDEDTAILTDENLANPVELFSDTWSATAFRRQYAQPAGVRVLNYSCSWGQKLTAALILPANYKKGRQYPTVTMMYEYGMSGTAGDARRYMSANLNPSNPFELASAGYAVLLADVSFQPGKPGLSSLQCLLPAVDAAIATGVVDEEKIGLHGHSWGGYQTLFDTTQTDRFAAAISGAGLSDLVSMYGGVYWYGLMPQHPIMEKSQGRMIDPIWKNWQGYVDNSPLFHAEKLNTPLLMLHNDADGAVGFYQGVAYFNALRRLQKPVVLLQYRGEGHGVEGRLNSIDYRQRHIEFWDHFLKGKPAPDWWATGVKPYDMKQHLKDRFPEPEPEEMRSD